MCGEQPERGGYDRRPGGSPPRVRGTGLAVEAVEQIARITPACAGNSLCLALSWFAAGDHPRVCGEQMYAAMFGHWPGGSPPRVRGTGRQAPMPSILTRITPACAGNSLRPLPLLRKEQDHPRVCGEQRKRPGHTPACQGSPPRVRGTAQGRAREPVGPRITPACAGNSAPAAAKTAGPRDHPRVCGEQEKPVTTRPAAIGSPPRVRGTGGDYIKLDSSARITPACAGNSSSPAPWLRRRRDHPRVCGEQLELLPGYCKSMGSPPRVRGTD